MKFHNPPRLDEFGHLQDPNDWNNEVATWLAAEDGIILEERHWQLIEFVRNYNEKYGTAPGMRLLVKSLKQTAPELASSRYLYQLFPESPARQLACYAGLEKPVSCI